MKFSLRCWFLSTAFLLVFIMTLLFTYSHHSMAYLDLGGLNGLHRVKLVPSYAGMQRLSKEGLLVKSCACHRCAMESSDTTWFDSRFDGNISPVWTKENMDLPLEVQRWWMVSPAVSLPRQKQLLSSCRKGEPMPPAWVKSSQELCWAVLQIIPKSFGPALWQKHGQTLFRYLSCVMLSCLSVPPLHPQSFDTHTPCVHNSP